MAYHLDEKLAERYGLAVDVSPDEMSVRFARLSAYAAGQEGKEK